MDRVACINLTLLPLQILMRKHPDWSTCPVALIAEEKPASPLLCTNPLAAEKGVHSGIRYSEALSLVPDLRAGSVSDKEQESCLEEIKIVLNRFSPDIEACSFDSNAIWVNVKGLQGIFKSPSRWVVAVREALNKLGYQATIVVGFTRFGSYGLSRSRPSSLILRSISEEQQALSHCPISSFPLAIRASRLLTRLGIKTVRDFQNLPIDGTLKRFGKETKAILDALRADRGLPIQAMTFAKPLVYHKRLDTALSSHHLLMEELILLLDNALTQLSSRAGLVSEVEITLTSEDGSVHSEQVRPARPSQNKKVLQRLIDLRLANIVYHSGIEMLSLWVKEAPSHSEQHDLFGPAHSQADAAAQAFALIRARLGNDAVVLAQLCKSHQPEKAFVWQTTDQLLSAKETEAAKSSQESQPHDYQPEQAQAVRRLFLHPPLQNILLTSQRRLAGPFLISKNWWELGEQSQPYGTLQYCFFLSETGDVSWLRSDGSSTHALGVVD